MKKFSVNAIASLFGIIILSGSVAAADNIRPYGNLYVFFGYEQSAAYDAGQKKEIDRDTFYTINEQSNLGFTFKYKKYNGVFELGISDSENDHNVKIRKAYGNYKFGSIALMIGQAWNPYVKWSHEAANYYRSEGFGALYEYPTTQLKISFLKIFYFDIIKPYVPKNKYYFEQPVDNPDPSDVTNQEYKIVEVEREITTQMPLEKIQSLAPKVAAGLDYKSKTLDVGAGLAGNIYWIDGTDKVKFNKKYIHSLMIYSNVRWAFYRNFEFNMSAGGIVNPANFGIAIQSKGNDRFPAGAAQRIENPATGKWEIKDTWNIQSYAEVGWKVSTTMLLHVGYGMSVVDYPIEGTERDYAWEVYGNLKMSVGGLIALTPAISYRDYMKDLSGAEEGNEIYCGLLATVSFY